MKNEWAEELLSIIQGTKEGLLKGVEIAQEQAPLVVQELLKWQYTLHLIGWIAGIVMLVCAILVIKKILMYLEKEATKRVNDELTDQEGLGVVAMVLFGAITIGGLILFAHQFIMWLKILIAPKVYLIQYLCQVMRGQ